VVDNMPSSLGTQTIDTPVPVTCINTPTQGVYHVISVKTTTWWNERGDLPDPASYHAWHHAMVQQILVTDMSQ
jgi:hypothetical protein